MNSSILNASVSEGGWACAVDLLMNWCHAGISQSDMMAGSINNTNRNPVMSSVPPLEAAMASHTSTVLVCETFNYLGPLRAITKCSSSKHQPNSEVFISGCFSESSQETQLEIPHSSSCEHKQLNVIVFIEFLKMFGVLMQLKIPFKTALKVNTGYYCWKQLRCPPGAETKGADGDCGLLTLILTKLLATPPPSDSWHQDFLVWEFPPLFLRVSKFPWGGVLMQSYTPFGQTIFPNLHKTWKSPEYSHVTTC